MNTTILNNIANNVNTRAIPFVHRRPIMSKDYVLKDFAEFDLFESLCVARNVETFVDEVFYDTNSQCFHIEIDDDYQHSDEAEKVKECALDSLSAFMFFDVPLFKRNEEV